MRFLTRARRKTTIVSIAVAASGLGLASVQHASAQPASVISFASDTSWAVFNSDPGRATGSQGVRFLGRAELVCLNDFSAYACPAGATDFDYPFGGGWPADLSAIPGAAWIWGAGVTASTAPAPLAEYFFSKTFILTGQPTGGTVRVAADDFAAIFVNGSSVGSIGSVTDIGAAGDAETVLHSFDIGSFLKPGANTITVEAQNGSAFFSPICEEGCPYDENPAGVVFGGSLSFVTDDA